ncbi:MAG TPA: hypothetical protein PKZ76_11290 [Xanthomonadaceae bacterium]|nr:hypothetical protein [Xanthomonadaceae bacterium]
MELTLRGYLFLVLVLASAAALADVATSYSRGLEAARVQDWAAVTVHMEEAIRGQAEPALRARLPGLRGEPYVPQYYLGLAAFHQGDCRGARIQWSRPDVSAVLDRLPSLKGSVDQALTECTRRVAELSPTTTPASAATETVTTPAQPPKAQPTPTSVASPRGSAPAALRNALDAYLGGRYGDVLDFDPTALPDARARAHGHLLRAAARHALAQLGDPRGNDQGALRADVRAARREQPGISIDATLFSPRFRSRFAELADGG